VCRNQFVPWPPAYLGGAGVKISRLGGSGFGFGFGAFLASFLPLSLLPMFNSMPQNTFNAKDEIASPASARDEAMVIPESNCSVAARERRRATDRDRCRLMPENCAWSALSVRHA